MVATARAKYLIFGVLLIAALIMGACDPYTVTR